VIDFSDNDIKKIDNFPKMTRLTSLLFHNNSVSRIHPTIGSYLPNLSSLLLNNNKINYFYEIEHLSSFLKLSFLSLLENPVAFKSYYREYTIYIIPQLKVLDFQKITISERSSIKNFFEKNEIGKAFLVTVETEKSSYYQQLNQKHRQLQQQQQQSQQKLNGSSIPAASSVTVPPPPPQVPSSSAKPLALTEEQKLQVKEAIENASTKEAIDLIEHQLKVRNALSAAFFPYSFSLSVNRREPSFSDQRTVTIAVVTRRKKNPLKGHRKDRK
jgi:hypothetical protein